MINDKLETMTDEERTAYLKGYENGRYDENLRLSPSPSQYRRALESLEGRYARACDYAAARLGLDTDTFMQEFNKREAATATEEGR